MKALRPLRLSFVHRTFEHDHKVLFVPTIMAIFPFDSPKSIGSEVELWKMVSAELGKSGVLDHLMYKSQGELLVTGSCFVPGGKPASSAHARVSLGPIDRTLYVFGDRTWGMLGPTDPTTFTKMPLDWVHAFGGEKYPQNPLGRGFSPLKTDKGVVHPLPNVEDPKRIIKSKGDKPPPASFGPVDITWPHNFAKMGTYDEAWRKEQFPGLATDIDFSVFNLASPEQRIEGYFRGDEQLRIENMHPEKPVIESRLPAVVARCFLHFAQERGGDLVEVPMHLDTVHLFPHLERGIVMFRGIRQIAEPDAADIAVGMAALEDLDEEPKPVSHYQTVMAQRLDKKKAHIYLLRDADLMPTSLATAPKVRAISHDPFDDIIGLEHAALRNAHHRAEKEIAVARERAIAAGADPSTLPTPSVEHFKQPSLDDLPGLVEKGETEIEKQKSQIDGMRAEVEASARAICEKLGYDYETFSRKAKRDRAKPPSFSADEELARIRALGELSEQTGVPMPAIAEKLADPHFADKLRAAEEQLHAAYRLGAHSVAEVPAMEPDDNHAAREEILSAYASGAKLTYRDFTGVDLSGIDLSGADLAEVYLGGANLSGANLSGANLDKAVLAHADLRGAKMALASLREANLGCAKLDGATLRGADLCGAILYETSAPGADMSGAHLDGALLMQLSFDGANLSGARGEKLFVLNAKLARACFANAVFPKLTILESDLCEADFSGARMEGLTLVTVQADNVVFDGAHVENVRIVHGSSMERASFRGTHMPNSNVRGTRLAGSDFTGATISRSDFSEADLSGAFLDRVDATDTRFVRTDLREAQVRWSNFMNGILQRARLDGANFDSSNLFAADLLGAIGDDKTRFTEANVKRVVRKESS